MDMNMTYSNNLGLGGLTSVTVSLGGSVEFSHLCHSESLLEFCPYLRFQAVPKHDPDLMLGLSWFDGLGQEVSTDFSDVLTSLQYNSHL